MLRIAIKRSNIKALMMPIAMLGGVVFYKWMEYVTFLSPYLIFLMLFITYCKLKISDFRPNKFEGIMLLAQMVLAAMVYGTLYFWDKTLAEGIFICCFIPTATAAPVITRMLGGSISRVATYSLICNAFVAVVGPVVFAAMSDNKDITFLNSFTLIIMEVFPLILMPLALAFLLRYLFPRLHEKVEQMQSLSFYLWAVSLFIVVGGCVSFTIRKWTPDLSYTMILLATGALIVCVLQFIIGRKIGRVFGDAVSGGQALGQKNTVLAVWLALVYMNPIASIAPAAYIAWQNIINSWQLARKSNQEKEKQQKFSVQS